MPHKFNADRRDKFLAAKYRVTNWKDYNEALRRRGDLTVWFDEDAIQGWSAPRRTSLGGQPVYSDLAIEVCSTLRSVFHQPLRQAQGLVRSLMTLMGLDLPVPDFSTLSRRARGLNIGKPDSRTGGPIMLIVPSQRCKHRLPGRGQYRFADSPGFGLE